MDPGFSRRRLLGGCLSAFLAWLAGFGRAAGPGAPAGGPAPPAVAGHAYDACGPAPLTVTRYTYDAGGRLTQVCDRDGPTTCFVYDASGRRGTPPPGQGTGPG